MSEIITPSILAERINKKTGIDVNTAKKFSFAFFSLIKNYLKNHPSFIIHKFGTFKKIRVEQTTGRNPRTNEQIIIPAHWKIRFTPCRSLAQRLNAKYAHLKAKAITLPFFKNEESKNFFVAEKTISVASAKENPSQKLAVPSVETEKTIQEFAVPPIDNTAVFANNTENSDDKNSDKKRTAILIGLGALLLAACLFLLIKLLGCSNTSETPVKEEKLPENEPSPTEQEVKETVPAADVSAEKEQSPEVSESVEQPAENKVQENEQTHRRLFNVPAGSCYYKISEKEFKNRHAWPIIYAENSQENPDPDLINAYASIFIPVINSLSDNEEKFKDSYLATYNAYYKIINAQPENPKNPIRKFRAVRVLVSGEIIYPGFIEEYKSRVEYQDYLDATAIFKNYNP